jgi:hypothetical protein
MRYTAGELDGLPTLTVGQADDLKIDDGHERHWLCRCGIADGMPYERTVTVERCIDGRWTVVETYDGDCIANRWY